MFETDRRKYVLFFAILLVGVGLDQWTKWYASERLATTRPGVVEHPITVRVPEGAEKMELRSFLAREFPANDPEMLDAIARSQVRTPDGKQLGASSIVKPGDKIVVRNRTVSVIDGYWEFEYTVNPGAAFGLLSESDGAYRRPFFIIVSFLAFGLILYLLRGVPPNQWLLVVSLSLIGTGAVGNLIDRVRFGHVVDFIVWKYTDQYRWPTFNIADALITVGVVIMLVEIFRGRGLEEPVSEDQEEAEADSAESGGTDEEEDGGAGEH